jgi:hypothetical protein
MRRLRITRPQEKVKERKLRKCDFPDFPEYLDYLYGQPIPDSRPLKIEVKGRLLRKCRTIQAQRNTRQKSEFNITALLLPERLKLTPYYETLPSEMNDKQKAVAVRWWLEREDENLNNGFSPITKKADLSFYPDRCLYRTISIYYGKLNKRETYVITAILYSLCDAYNGYYNNVVSYLIRKHNRLFPSRKEVNTIIQRLMNKRIVRCKISFRESGKERLLKPQIILNVVRDVEQAGMYHFEAYESMLPPDPEYDTIRS